MLVFLLKNKKTRYFSACFLLSVHLNISDCLEKFFFTKLFDERVSSERTRNNNFINSLFYGLTSVAIRDVKFRERTGRNSLHRFYTSSSLAKKVARRADAFRSGYLVKFRLTAVQDAECARMTFRLPRLSYGRKWRAKLFLRRERYR